jgi:hypothetical protein
MSDDKTNRGQQDRSRIALGEKYAVQFWTKELKVTEEQLQAAVSAVGNSADAVRRHLLHSKAEHLSNSAAECPPLQKSQRGQQLSGTVP